MGGKKKKTNSVAVLDPEEEAKIKEHGELQRRADRIVLDTRREQGLYNELQQQKEKLQYFWAIAQKTVEERKSELRDKEREQQDLEERHKVEIKKYKQKLKHLFYEHQNDLTVKRLDNERSKRMTLGQELEGLGDLREDRRALDEEAKEVGVDHDGFILALKKEQDRKITDLRHEFERRAEEVQRRFEGEALAARERMGERRAKDIRILERRKEEQIASLMGEHHASFSNIKHYYSDITHNNLDLIKSLKEEVKELEVEDRRNTKKLADKKVEHRRMVLPLKKMEEDLVRLRLQFEEYEKEKEELRLLKREFAEMESKLESTDWEMEILGQKHSKVLQERDELRSAFTQSRYQVAQQTSFSSFLMAKKLSAMQRIREKKEAEMAEVLARANLEPSVYAQLSKRVGNVLDEKNHLVSELENELDRIQHLRSSLSQHVNHLLRMYGVKRSDLGADIL